MQKILRAGMAVGLVAWLTILLHAATPVLSVSPTSLAVDGVVGVAPSSTSFTIRNTGKGALKWTVATTAPWLHVAPNRGTNTGTVQVTFDSFAATGTYVGTVQVSGNKQQATVTVTVTVAGTPPPPPPPLGVGPQTSITCPAGAVDVLPGASIQSAVNANPSGTTFCLHAGTFSITSAITPKSSDTFVGQYGAILDGSGWSTTDTTQAAFRAHNQDIDDVTIRNLVIQHMPQRGIHAFKDFSDRWTVEYNEIAYNQTGMNMASGSTISRNYVHHNLGDPTSPTPALRGGGYQCYKCVGTTFDSNEFAYNGPEQKLIANTNGTFSNNYFHDDYKDGIWYDGACTGGLVEGNTLEREPGESIFYEISTTGTIRNNIVRRGGDNAIFISTSKSVTITGNTLENNYRSIEYFLNCGVVGQGPISYDLANNSAHDNTIIVPASSGAFATGLSWVGTCTSAQTAPYSGGSKNLSFDSNAYHVPNLSAKYWVWGFAHLVTWSEWLAVPQDTHSTLVVLQ